MISKFPLKPFAAAALSALIAAGAHAGVVIGPVAVSASVPDLSASYSINNLINQSGISAGYVSGVTDFSTYVATTTLTANPSSPNNGGWASTAGNAFPVNLDFDLGAVTTVTRMALWNDLDVQALGAFQIYASADAGFGSLSLLGSFNGVVHNLGGLAQVFDMSDASTRYLRIVGRPVQDVNGLLNIGEIAFEGGSAAAVPEPGSLALAGVALLGLALRGRRRQA